MVSLIENIPHVTRYSTANAGERTRTSTGITPQEPKSCASASSATPAWSRMIGMIAL